MPTPKTSSKAHKLPYPKLPDHKAPGVTSAIFWLAAYQREEAISASFSEYCESAAVWKIRGKNAQLSAAFSDAKVALVIQARQNFRYLVESGGVLFAWDNTTALNGVPA